MEEPRRRLRFTRVRSGLRLLERAARSAGDRHEPAGSPFPARLDDLGGEGREGNEDEPGENAQEHEDPAPDHE
jgi:hypothetical protein